MRLREWWHRIGHRGEHRRGRPRGPESIHAVTAAARVEEAKLAEAQARAREAEVFLREFRRAFGLRNGHGTGRPA